MSALSQARAWIEADPNATDRRELEALLARAESNDAAAEAELTDRFRGPLQFGTAGLRGVMGAGETRMNEAVVIRATYGLVRYLIDNVADAKTRGIVIGRDARLRSDELARAAAEVAAGLGMRVHLLFEPAPTPLTAFAVTKLGAAAGVVVTASHNPPEYNGYKVFYDNGAQIIPPHDTGIRACIDAAPAAREIMRTPVDLDAALQTDVEAAYLDAVVALRHGGPPEAIKVCYTPLHGVGGRFFGAALERAGFSSISTVAEQLEPDGRFPTVTFPNPEEPTALTRLLSLARKRGADVALANDPDADRLAAAVPDDDGQWAALSGNEIGVLMAHHLLTRDASEDPSRLVITTVVSSQLLQRMAAAMNVRYAETLTGFKWIANKGLELEASENAQFLFGYEEALGYTVRTVARDKDGIGAAVVFAELVSACKAAGESVPARLARIRDQYGHFVALQKSIVLPGQSGAGLIAAAMQALRAAPPKDLAGASVSSFWDLSTQKRQTADGEVSVTSMPPSNTVILELAGGGRAAVRPSGTEPKIKLYLEVEERREGDESLEAVEARGRERLDQLLSALLTAAGLEAA